MAHSWTSRAPSSPTATTPEIPSSSPSPILSPASPRPAPTPFPSPLLTPRTKTTAVYNFNSNCEPVMLYLSFKPLVSMHLQDSHNHLMLLYKKKPSSPQDYQISIIKKLNNIMLKQGLIVLLAVCLAATISVDPDTTLFVDQYGRYAVFHGVNAVQKLFPFYPKLDHFDANYSLADEDLSNLRGWGLNVIRLHVAWEGVEPQRGVYNYTYIEKLRQVVQKCNKFGIYVILDAHQDLFNRQFCGQGFPDWAIERRNFPFPINIKMDYDEHGNPNRTKCLSVQFALFYTSEDVMRFQEDFFTNKRGLLDQFTKMWQRVAAYVGKEPNLLGYQILNEPIGANFYRSPADTLLPGQSNNKFLLPAYKKVYQGIRKYDPVNLIFYEPSVIDVFAGGFYQTIGGQAQKSRQVFSYHIYCPYVTKLGEPVNPQFCAVFDQLQIASKEINAKKMRVGAFMTEYGALSDSKKSAGEITVLTDEMSKYFRSWTYWQFKYFDDITTAASPGTTESFYDLHGNLQQNKVRALSRPYAYAICGRPIEQQFKKGVYTLKWVSDRDCFNKNTEVFLSPKFHFPNGFTTQFDKCKQCKLNALPLEGYYEVVVDRNHLLPIKLTVKPK